MSSAHYPEKACIERKSTSPLRGRNISSKHPFFEKGIMEIGKLNIVLMGLIVVILIGLISQDENSTSLSSQAVRVQSVTTPEIAALESQDDTPVTVEAQAEPEKSELKTSPKIHKKNEKTAPESERNKQTELVAGNPSTNAESIPEDNTRQETEHLVQKEPSRNILVFNIWSVSELRLRSAFTKFINDGSAPASIVDSRKKEYLTFVNKRTHKCGELHNKFASNINTVEKLTFKDKDVETLECHTTENITELNRLNE